MSADETELDLTLTIAKARARDIEAKAADRSRFVPLAELGPLLKRLLGARSER